MAVLDNKFWQDLQLVVFDVDGTLYQQSKLRKIMFFRLISWYIFRPWRYREILILYSFRKEREKKAGYHSNNLEEEQYNWCAEKTGCKPEEVKKVVNYWMFEMPNKYLLKCRYPGIDSFVYNLKYRGIKTAILSDYNSLDKLKKMQIEVDLQVSATDPMVNSLKPMPDGLNLILFEMKIYDKKKCLFIGDRLELDGECARRAQVPFLLVDEINARNDFYHILVKELISSKD